jgi:hypothetical protein
MTSVVKLSVVMAKVAAPARPSRLAGTPSKPAHFEYATENIVGLEKNEKFNFFN